MTSGITPSRATRAPSPSTFAASARKWNRTRCGPALLRRFGALVTNLNARTVGLRAELRDGLFTALALAAVVLLLAASLLSPSRSDVLKLGAFLLASGGL